MMARAVQRVSVQRGFLPAQSLRSIRNTTKNTSLASTAATALVITYLWAYMSQVRPYVDENLCVLILPVLLASTYKYVRRPASIVLAVTTTLTTLIAYYFAVTQDVYLVRSYLGYVLILAYCFSLKPIRTEQGLRRVALGLAMFFAISMATMVATVWSDSVASARRQLFPVDDAEMMQLTELGSRTDSEDMIQGGLKRHLHAFGYQVAAGATFVAMVALTSVGKRRWLWFPMAVLSVFVLLVAGERSAVLSFAASLALVGFIRRRTASLFGFAAVVTIALVVLLPQLRGITDVRQYNIFNRLDSGERDYQDRLGLQLWTIGEIARRPLGLYLDGVDYAVVAPIVNDQNILTAPHNGYLTRTLFFGWPVMVFLLVLGWLWSRGIRSTRLAARHNHASDLEYIGLASLGAVALNALFHNASVVTFQEETLVLLFFYLAAVRAREHREWTRMITRPFRPTCTSTVRSNVRPIRGTYASTAVVHD